MPGELEKRILKNGIDWPDPSGVLVAVVHAIHDCMRKTTIVNLTTLPGKAKNVVVK